MALRTAGRFFALSLAISLSPCFACTGPSPCPDLETLLKGTLDSVLSYLDPSTGLLYDRRRLLDADHENPAGGVLPDLPDWRFTPDQAKDLAVELFSGTPGLTLDHGLRLSYTTGTPSGFGFLAIPANLRLDVPRISGIDLRARASIDHATLEVKLECADGRQQIWNADLGPGEYAWTSFVLPDPVPCDMARVDRLTFAAVDTELNLPAGTRVVWEIDHLAFRVDPAEIGRAPFWPRTQCDGAYVPLPCRGFATSVDNVGYGLAALGVAACVGYPVTPPGFGSTGQAILRGLETLASWPKWNGEVPQNQWTTKAGFPWTWFSPSNGLPPPGEIVFALDEAHLAAGLRVVEQAASWDACRLDPALRDAIRAKAGALRQAMDWSLLVRQGDLALAWINLPGADGCAGLCGTEIARGNESILRTFLTVASGAVPANYFERLSCELTQSPPYAWYKTFLGDSLECSSAFVQEAPALFLDLSKLPKSPSLAARGHLDSLVQLLRAQQLDQPGLHGRSDCLLPDGSAYVTGCDIPDSVVTPQAAILGLEFVPEAAAVLCEFHNAGVDRPYQLGDQAVYRGMRDSYDLASQSVGNAVFLALSQARNTLALFNLLYPDFTGSGLPVVRALLARDPDGSAAYEVLGGMTVCGARMPRSRSRKQKALQLFYSPDSHRTVTPND